MERDSRLWDRRLSDLRKVNLKTREDVTNVFTPFSPVTEPVKFAGRGRQLEGLIKALLSKGADIVVFGERGCGKSSLARMLYEVANGRLGLLDYYGLRAGLEERGLLRWFSGQQMKKFNTIWVDGFSRNFDEVARSILTRRADAKNGPGLLSYIPKEADQIEISSKIGFDKIFSASGEVKEVHVPEKPLNVKEGFDLAIQQYSRYHEEELLIFIDEFETVSDRATVAQYMKSVQGARFIIVGISESALELIGSHASVARETHASKLKPMERLEMRTLLDIGAEILLGSCVISDEVRDRIIDLANGSPYWCQFLAQQLVQRNLDLAIRAEDFLNPPSGEPWQIEIGDLRKVMVDLPDNPDCTLFEEQLTQVTLNDRLCRAVLQAAAASPNSLISSQDVVATVDESIASPEQVREMLNGMIEMEGGPFERRASLRSDLFSFVFRVPNFRRYVLIRLSEPV